MINLHFNGDIIRCPDIGAIQQQLARQRKKLSICQFGCQESNCKLWTDWQMLRPKERLNRRCNLFKQYKKDDSGFKIYKCPKAAERYANSLKQKHFRIDNTNYRKIASAAHHLVKTSEYKSLFLLLSFPPWLPGFNPYKNENKLNECFSNFMENLRQNYNCQGYIAARELGKNTRRYHYHLVCSIPFVPFAALNSAWCAAISDICETSRNAVMSRKENRIIQRINSPARAVRYICKYISKCKNQASKSRILFMSNNLIKKPISIRNEEYALYNHTGVMNIQSYLLQFKSVKVTKLNDFCSAFRIDSNQEFDQICNEIIYPMFYIDLDKHINLYSYPGISPPKI